MTTSYPGGLDSFTNPTGTDELDDSIGGRTHSQFHADLNDAVEAIQAKLGTTTTPATFSAGTAAAPALTFTGDTNTGIYQVGADSVGVATGGSVRAAFASTPNLTLTAVAATDVPLVAKGASGQSANLQEWRDSTGAVRTSVTSWGYIGVGSSAPSRLLTAFDIIYPSNLQIRVGYSDSYMWEFGRDNATGKFVLADESDTKLTIDNSGHWTFKDGATLNVGTTTGTKIGGATTQKIGFYNATPIVQGSAVADATGAGDVVAQLNALLARIRSTGLIAT